MASSNHRSAGCSKTPRPLHEPHCKGSNAPSSAVHSSRTRHAATMSTCEKDTNPTSVSTAATLYTDPSSISARLALKRAAHTVCAVAVAISCAAAHFGRPNPRFPTRRQGGVHMSTGSSKPVQNKHSNTIEHHYSPLAQSISAMLPNSVLVRTAPASRRWANHTRFQAPPDIETHKVQY